MSGGDKHSGVLDVPAIDSRNNCSDGDQRSEVLHCWVLVVFGRNQEELGLLEREKAKQTNGPKFSVSTIASAIASAMAVLGPRPNQHGNCPVVCLFKVSTGLFVCICLYLPTTVLVGCLQVVFATMPVVIYGWACIY